VKQATKRWEGPISLREANILTTIPKNRFKQLNKTQNILFEVKALKIRILNDLNN
jgi:hypothetical protein